MAYARRFGHGVGAADLAWLTDIVWPGSAAVGRAGGRPAEAAYLVLPGVRSPWLVMPRLTRTGSLRALAEGHRLLTRRQRAIRLAAAGGVLVARRGRGDDGVDDGLDDGLDDGGLVLAPPAGHDAAGLVERLAERLGDVRPLVLLGEADPNRKPTLQLVDRRGGTLGYAKVGWNPGTRAMVRREAAALTALSGRLPADSRVRTPGLLFAETFDDLGQDVVVTRPMPRRARRVSADSALDDDLVLTIAAAVGKGLVDRAAREWRVWDDLRSGLDRVHGVAPVAGATVRAAVETAVEALPPQARGLEGGWHGDLVPWNIAAVGDERWVWDWEHAEAGRPVGLDLLHHRFAVDRHARRLGTPDSVRGVVEVAHRRLPGLGVSRTAIPAVVVAYLALRWLRAAELAASGAGWDAAVHPSLVTAIADLAAP